MSDKEKDVPTEDAEPESDSGIGDLARKVSHVAGEGIKKATPVVVKSAKAGAHLVAVGSRKGAELAATGAGKAKDLVVGFWKSVTEKEAPLSDDPEE